MNANVNLGMSNYPGVWDNFYTQRGGANAARPTTGVPLSQSMKVAATPVTQEVKSAPDPMMQARGQMEQLRMRLGDPDTRLQLAQKFADMFPAPPSMSAGYNPGMVQTPESRMGGMGQQMQPQPQQQQAGLMQLLPLLMMMGGM